MAMNPEVKKLWVEALRSGEYEQCHYSLKSGNRFCCLGVLCDLHSKETGKGSWAKDEKYEAKNISLTAYPPKHVLDWAKLNTAIFDNVDLYELNDNDKLTFDWIAAIIETEL